MRHSVIGWLGVAVLAGAGALSAANTPVVPATDAGIARQVIHEARMYPQLTIWDNLQVRVHDGNVELTGAVTQPYKKSDLGRLAERVSAVKSVTNDLEVLPLSPLDNQLRWQVARAIYGDPALSRYAMGALPSIHIIVDNGRVTLEGVVATQMDKQIAGMRANTAGTSFGPVVNNLQVADPPHKG